MKNKLKDTVICLTDLKHNGSYYICEIPKTTRTKIGQIILVETKEGECYTRITNVGEAKPDSGVFGEVLFISFVTINIPKKILKDSLFGISLYQKVFINEEGIYFKRLFHVQWVQKHYDYVLRMLNTMLSYLILRNQFYICSKNHAYSINSDITRYSDGVLYDHYTFKEVKVSYIDNNIINYDVMSNVTKSNFYAKDILINNINVAFGSCFDELECDAHIEKNYCENILNLVLKRSGLEMYCMPFVNERFDQDLWVIYKETVYEKSETAQNVILCPILITYSKVSRTDIVKMEIL